MTRLYVDATTVIALGAIGELDLLLSFDGIVVVLPTIRAEVTAEPAKTNLDRVFEREGIQTTSSLTEADEDRAMEVLGESDVNGDVRVIGAVLAHTAADESVAIVSDDRRLRTVARGLGARVTGTVGVIVRAVEDGRSAEDGKQLVRRVDDHGLHMTGELREHADRLIEDAAR